MTEELDEHGLQLLLVSALSSCFFLVLTCWVIVYVTLHTLQFFLNLNVDVNCIYIFASTEKFSKSLCYCICFYNAPEPNDMCKKKNANDLCVNDWEGI